MGNKVSYKPRKATFREVNKGEYQPVNKRAVTVTRKLGKRNRLAKNIRVSIAELRSTKGKGTYKLYKYTADNSLVAIR